MAAADGRPVRVDDASGRGDLMLRSDDLGPYRIQRGERQVAIAFYRWSETTELVFTFRPLPTP